MNITQQERDKLYRNVRIAMGAPVVNVEIVDEQLDFLLENVIQDMSSFLNDWIVRQQWASLSGKSMSDSDIWFALTTKSLDTVRSFTYAYSKQAGLNESGEYELKKDFFEIEANKQIYNIPAGREINEVLWYGNIASIDRGQVYNYSGTFQSDMYGWSYSNIRMNRLLPLYSVLSFASHAKLADRMYNSDMFYKITGGPNGSKNIHIYPIPFEGNDSNRLRLNDLNGYKVWYWYYEPKEREKCLDENDDIVRLPSDATLERIPYSKFSDAFKNRIRKLLIAEANILLGTIRGKWSGEVGFDDAQKTMDYRMMLDKGEKDKEKVMEELKAYMENFEYNKVIEQEANIAENVNKVMGFVPMKRPINLI